jgi:integrase
MPKAKGYAMKAIRLDRERGAFDLEYNGERVRGVIMVDALVALIRGQVDQESNLAPGAQPILFGDFATADPDTGVYGPFCAKLRLDNPISLKAEVNLVKAVGVEIGKTYLHEITGPDLERLKTLWVKKKVAPNTIKRRLNALRRVMDYAVATGKIKMNPLPRVKGLKTKNRAEIWLRTEEFDRLLLHCDPTIRLLVEYLGLCGARISEALDFRTGDLRDGRLLVPTQKRGVPSREMMREFNTASLGPRWRELEERLIPHPQSGFYFHANERGKTGEPLSYSHFQRLFNKARIAAGLPCIRPHDLRGTFCVNRAMVVKDFRQLQIEMGHSNARSIDAYLARAKRFDPKDSYFYDPETASTATASPPPAAQQAPVPAKSAEPEPFPANPTLH